MKIEWGLVWALLLGLFLMPFAKGDVCQKGLQTSRIKMTENEDGSFQFLSCRGKTPCTPLGPSGAVFTLDELTAKHDALDSIRAGGGAGDTAGSILGLFLLGTGNLKLANESFDEGKKHGDKAAVAKAKMQVLESQYLTSDDACTDVSSLPNHRTILAGVLKEIDKDRKKAAADAAIAAAKVEADAKLKSAQTPEQNRTTPAGTPGSQNPAR